MPAPLKSLFDMGLNQTVHYPSRKLRVTRSPLSIYDRQDDYKFIGKWNCPDGRVMCATLLVSADSMDDFPTEVLLAMLEQNVFEAYKEAVFRERMSQIKRGIRGKVRKHLRKKNAALA